MRGPRSANGLSISTIWSQPERIGPEQQSAFERRKAEAEDQAQIDVARHRWTSSSCKIARRFQHHRQEQPGRDLLWREFLAAAN